MRNGPLLAIFQQEPAGFSPILASITAVRACVPCSLAAPHCRSRWASRAEMPLGSPTSPTHSSPDPHPTAATNMGGGQCMADLMNQDNSDLQRLFLRRKPPLRLERIRTMIVMSVHSGGRESAGLKMRHGAEGQWRGSGSKAAAQVPPVNFTPDRFTGSGDAVVKRRAPRRCSLHRVRCTAMKRTLPSANAASATCSVMDCHWRP